MSQVDGTSSRNNTTRRHCASVDFLQGSVTLSHYEERGGKANKTLPDLFVPYKVKVIKNKEHLKTVTSKNSLSRGSS